MRPSSQFKRKQRLYRDTSPDLERARQKLHSKSNIRRFCECVAKGNIAKVRELCAKVCLRVTVLASLFWVLEELQSVAPVLSRCDDGCGYVLPR